MDTINGLIGIDAEELNVLQMGLRAIIIYISALFIIRVGDRRFLGKATAFDFILAIIIGSVLSRAINGQAEFFPSIITGLVLVGIHWTFGGIAYRSHFFGKLIKGSPRTIINNGKINWREMKKAHITRGDLEMEMRNEAHINRIREIKKANLERNGKISFINSSTSGPKILDLNVENGVKTVRIKFE